MKDKTDIQLINFIKEGRKDNEALKELIRRHSGIFISVINNICHNKSCVEFSDLISDKEYYIYRSAMKYDESRQTKFCTFLGNEARWLALNLITFKNKFKTEALSENPQDLTQNFEASRKTTAIRAMNSVIELAQSSEDPRVRRIFHFRYMVGDRNKVMPWKIISKKLDLSIQGCINIHNNFIEKIKNKIL